MVTRRVQKYKCKEFVVCVCVYCSMNCFGFVKLKSRELELYTCPVGKIQQSLLENMYTTHLPLIWT